MRGCVAPDRTDGPLPLTVAIKALNEQDRIAETLRHAVAAARLCGGEVLLADSGSDDATVAIARQFPVRIVQLARREDRCCGAGAQLAFQEARGRYFYLLDGDMLLDPAFLPAAIAHLEGNPDIAGVGGELRERAIANSEFAIRAQAAARLRPQGEAVGHLDGGGLYRRSAVESVGYFADRNLRAFEELDLGWRLRSAGWRLARIPIHAIDHFGHAMPGYALLWRRLRSGYAGGAGQVARAALGKPWFPALLRGFGHVRNSIVVLLWWCLLATLVLAGAFWPWGAILLILPLAFLLARRRSLPLACYTFVAWNGIALATIAGFLRPRTPPTLPLAAVTLAEAPPLRAEEG